MRFEMARGTGILKELRLPWTIPLAEWPAGTSAELGKNDRLVRARGRRYLLTSLPEERSRGAFSDLEVLETHGLPVVTPIGLVAERDGLPSLLVTAWPQDAIPLEDALGGSENPMALAEALAVLLVRLHLAGYQAGPSATRNPLIVEDEHRPVAVMSDFRHGSLHGELSEAQRESDLEASRVNLARIVRDAGQRRRERLDPESFADAMLRAYRRIWGRISNVCLFSESGEIELKTRIVPSESLPEETRTELRRNGKATSVGLRVRSRWEGCDHALLLELLTGLVGCGESSRDLLRDIFRTIGWLEFSTKRKWSLALAANRWLREVYEPAMASLSHQQTGERCH